MRILFVMNTPGFLRYYDETVKLLLERGHDVKLAFTLPELRPESLEILRDWPRRPEILGKAMERHDRYATFASNLRRTIDYVRFLDPQYAKADFLRGRRRGTIRELSGPTALLRRFDTLPRWAVKALLALLLRLEDAVPSSVGIERHLRDSDIDAVVVSPLVTNGSPQTDLVKSARALGIPCAASIASWDNLTNKGLLRVTPDRVFVWNEAQAREATDLHGVPRQRVLITGAQPFDRWFDRVPARSRAGFCRGAGLDPDRQIVLFLGSTSNITESRREDKVQRKWAKKLRAGPGRAASASLLIRPHPDRRGEWSKVKLSDLDGVVVWPPERPRSIEASARNDLFESLYYSDVVVGINTSSMIEAAIIGRPVLTLRLPDFEQSHEGTLHFGHLLPENGGFVRSASSFSEHGRQVSEALERPELGAEERERFVERFVRPFGREEAATPRLVEAIEGLAASRPEVTRPRLLSGAVRPLVWMLAGRSRTPRSEIPA